jgi:pyruvate dehydrogenase E2 component (dihydrolipoamide acetyltransferase)
MRNTRHLRGIKASPRVRKLAETRGIDLTTVRGSGPGGRLLDHDLDARVIPSTAIATRHAAALMAPPAHVAQPVTSSGPSRREKMTPVELATARHMARCWQTIPHTTFFRDAPAGRFEAQRQAAKRTFGKLGIKLTATAIIAKLVAGVIRNNPRFNASLDETSGEIVYHEPINIGIAADTPRGLVVPVIHDVEHKSLGAVAGELTQLVASAREGRLRAEQMRGGTFTISNLGPAHPSFFAPIVNAPEVAILGVGGSRPTSGDANSLAMPLSLSVDHRVLNGADAARFLEALCEAIAEPLTALLI